MAKTLNVLQHDGVSDKDVETLVDTFPGQSIDFFGALRARVYDDKVPLSCLPPFKLFPFQTRPAASRGDDPNACFSAVVFWAGP